MHLNFPSVQLTRQFEVENFKVNYYLFNLISSYFLTSLLMEIVISD